ncbi:urocortin-3-like isoform X2 [Salvelinus fontinalis]|nr:urocortin-3-like isoform X2 [Salvelinus fontinalis]XP_055768375.1 urocortin-3-like isoform X2 [Salvelinus fontinalis]XP_055768376.1 urocortin-3-like isoform X2 [Salvelinus fontinalis]
MMPFLRTLVVLAVLCAPTSSLCLRLYQSDSSLLCDDDILAETSDVPSEEFPVSESWGSLFKSGDTLSSVESREKRTSTYPANYRFLSQTQLRSKMFQNSINNDRLSKFTLSLDVPTNIMNILFDIQKSKNLRAKAADNARLMAQIGRRKRQ